MDTRPNASNGTRQTVTGNQNPSTHSRSVERLFRCTVNPSDRSLVQQLVKDTEKELQSYDVEINKLMASLASLRHKRDRTKKKLVQYRSLLSPIHRLPPEVLQRVFSMLNGFLVKPSPTNPAIAASSTCGRWRDIAISTPTLWASFAIDFANWDGRYEALTSATRLFLDRSRTSQLELSLIFERRSLRRGEIPCLENLVQHSNRWREVILMNFTPHIAADSVFSSIKGRLPCLSKLAVLNSKARDEAGLRCDHFSICPALSSFTLYPGSALSPSCPFPWTQIRSFETGSGTGADVVESVSQLPGLENLTIWECSGADEDEHCVNSSVKHLSIAASNMEKACGNFNYITFQCLSSLEISCSYDKRAETFDGSEEWDERQVSNFFARSACVVTSLSIRKISIIDEQVLRFLGLMPALATLELEEHPVPHSNKMVTPHFLNKLTVDHQQPGRPFLPRLANIRFVLHSDESVMKVLPEVLASRYIPDADDASELGTACIKSVDIVLLKDNDGGVEALTTKLGWLGEAGVRITVAERVGAM
ncbi:hypothetical protein VNI00_017961 [Paramarasmius palmivorus]|uniref:F-box domain-containing protein n=1 Tax=Paramarasmius palmivorus TaxID=297713 RepID=A0AAW0B382_9AGAR